MADLVEYTVAREHLGDKITDDGMVATSFAVGDTRLADPAIVKHLVGTVLIDPNAEIASTRSDEPTVEEMAIAEKERAAAKEKAARQHAGKAEGNAPANKADQAPENKAK